MVVDRTYDPKCYDLAAHFVQDRPEFNDEPDRIELARVLQEAIEDWFFDKESKYCQATADQPPVSVLRAEVLQRIDSGANKAGQELLHKLEWLSKVSTLPGYVRTEVAEILALARKAVV